MCSKGIGEITWRLSAHWQSRPLRFMSIHKSDIRHTMLLIQNSDLFHMFPNFSCIFITLLTKSINFSIKGVVVRSHLGLIYCYNSAFTPSAMIRYWCKLSCFCCPGSLGHNNKQSVICFFLVSMWPFITIVIAIYLFCIEVIQAVVD